MELITFTRTKQSFGWRDSADCKHRGTKISATKKLTSLGDFRVIFES